MARRVWIVEMHLAQWGENGWEPCVMFMTRREADKYLQSTEGGSVTRRIRVYEPRRAQRPATKGR